MTAELDDMRATLIAAVQAELDRYGASMMAEIERLRSSSAADREVMRQAFGEQLQSLAATVEQAHARNEQFQHAMRQAIDTRLGEAESRTARRFDDMDTNLAGMVQDVARPALQEIRDDQTGLVRRIEALDTNLRRFDEQAARMVTYFNEMTQAMEQRTAELSEQLQTNVEGRLSALTVRFDESESDDPTDADRDLADGRHPPVRHRGPSQRACAGRRGADQGGLGHPNRRDRRPCRPRHRRPRHHAHRPERPDVRPRHAFRFDRRPDGDGAPGDEPDQLRGAR